MPAMLQYTVPIPKFVRQFFAATSVHLGFGMKNGKPSFKDGFYIGDTFIGPEEAEHIAQLVAKKRDKKNKTEEDQQDLLT